VPSRSNPAGSNVPSRSNPAGSNVPSRSNPAGSNAPSLAAHSGLPQPTKSKKPKKVRQGEIASEKNLARSNQIKSMFGDRRVK
jgi:hypothetical protein